jgi:hypothetical protein
VGSTGQSGPGASGGYPISTKALLLGSVNRGSQIFDFSIVLVGVLGIVLGLLLALSHGAVATRVPGLGVSILSRSAPIGFGIAAGGAMICLVGILLLSQLPRTG